MSRERFEQALAKFDPESRRRILETLAAYEHEAATIKFPPLFSQARSIAERASIAVVTLRVIALFRSRDIFAGTLSALSDDNAFAMAILMRSHYETTAALGYNYRIFDRVVNGEIEIEEADKQFFDALVGSKDAELRERGAPEIKNILTMFDHADQVLKKLTPQEIQVRLPTLREHYNFLSEFAHPNAHSNSLVFRYDPSIGEPRLVREGVAQSEEIELLNYLGFSASAFFDIYFSFTDLMKAED